MPCATRPFEYSLRGPNTYLIPSYSCRLAPLIISFVNHILLIVTNIRTSLLTSSLRYQLLVFSLVLVFLRLQTRLDSRFQAFLMFFILPLLFLSFLILVYYSREPIGLVICQLSRDLLALLTLLSNSQVSLQYVDFVDYQLSKVLLTFKLVKQLISYKYLLEDY